ncbi:MAG: 50S ribosomal protein L10 [Candidatus Micrarchaeota archaeon]
MPSEKILKQKSDAVEKLAKQIKSAKVIAVIDLKELPSRQYQKIKKALEGKAEFAVAKNSIIQRAFEKAKVGKELVKEMKGPTGLIMTEMNPFELYKVIKRNSGKAAAKPGQIAPFDIVVPAGETNIPPGPGLSELKLGKIDARIAGGKVVIGKDSTVAKKGEKITGPVAKALSKLDITPFEVRMRVPVVLESGMLYSESVLDINEVKFMSDLWGAAGAAFGLSVSIAYVTPSNIRVLLGKAHRDALGVGVEAEIYDSGVIEMLLAKACRQAGGLKPKRGS